MGRALSLVYQRQALFNMGRESDAEATLSAVLPLLEKYREAMPVPAEPVSREGDNKKE